MAITAAKLQVEVDADTRDLEKGMGRANQSVGGFKDKLKSSIKTIAKWGVAAGVVAVGVGAKVLDLGAQYQDMDAKASTVFEGQLGMVQDWAKENAGAMGLTARELTGLTANFADLLKPMGFTAEQAAEMATETNELSGALAMWSGGTKTAAEVSEILSKAMLGEREGLKQLGVAISEADVQARLAAKGQEELTGAALEQAKAVATQELIMEKSTDAQKRYEEGQGSLTVRMNKAKASFKEFKEKAVEALLPVVVSLIEKGQELVEEWGPPVKEWFGDKGPKALAAAKKALDIAGAAIGWVRQNSEWLIPVVGGLAAAFVGYTVVTKTMAAAQAIATAAQWALNAALAANPIGLVIVAVAGLVAGLAIAWKTSETFRDKVRQAWDAVQDAARRLTANVIGGIRLLVDAFLGFAETMIGAAAKAFGWVPGLGDKLETAHAEIKGFREKANEELSKMQTTVRMDADIGPAQSALRTLRADLRAIQRDYGYNVATVGAGGTGGGLVSGRRQHGGPVWPGGTFLVGEAGPELFTPSRSGRIIPNQGTGGGVNIEQIIVQGFVGNEKQLADEISEMLRRREQAMR